MRRIANPQRSLCKTPLNVKLTTIPPRPRLFTKKELKSEKNIKKNDKEKEFSVKINKKFGYVLQNKEFLNLEILRRKLINQVQCMPINWTKESQMVIKNSLIYRKLESEFENERKQFNKEKASLNRSVKQIVSEIQNQRNGLEKLLQKKQKLERQIDQYHNTVTELKNKNYELFWDFCAKFQIMNQEDEYQQLLELQEQIGDVSRGLPERQIEKLIYECQSEIKQKVGVNQTCCVCYSGIQTHEKLITLPCKHFYHAECITNWLKINKICPLCRRQIE